MKAHFSGHWTDGLNIRCANVLLNCKLKNKEEVRKAFESGKLHPIIGWHPRNYGWQSHQEVAAWLGIEIPRKSVTKANRDRDLLRGALLALVACPDYRNIQTHEMTRARKALEDTQP